jgi:predicted tellurium resistance membrane protein TerC
MNELIQQFSANPWISLGVIFNLIVIESLLSVDNAAVLATMVMDLEPKQRNRALRYGIWGAYVFRGLAMIFAGFLIGFWWLKPLGGMYLLWLAADQFKEKLGYGERGTMIFKILSLLLLLGLIRDDGSVNITALWVLRGLIVLALIYFVYAIAKLKGSDEEDDEFNKSNNKIYNFFIGKIGPFWATVILVEIMDMAFSIDNIFAAVAFVDKFPNPLKYFLVCAGVFVGILAMRFVAQAFVKLMERYNFLETAAFIVITILGVKLLLSLYEHYYPDSSTSLFLASHTADIVTSVLTISVFFVPILTSSLFNFPKRSLPEAAEKPQ